MEYPLEYTDNYNTQIGMCPSMPILVAPFDYTADGSDSPQSTTATELLPAMGALSVSGYGAEVNNAGRLESRKAMTAAAGVCGDRNADRERESSAVWREWIGVAKKEERGRDAVVVDRRMSGSEVSEFDSLSLSLSLPELDYSISPDQSPASLYVPCATPPQDCVNAVCDVPLLAPRPLPCIPPALFQFDCLPDDNSNNNSNNHQSSSHKRKRSPTPPPLHPRTRPLPHTNHTTSAIGQQLPIPPHFSLAYAVPHDSKRRKSLAMTAVNPPPSFHNHNQYHNFNFDFDFAFAQAHHPPHHAERLIMPNSVSDFRTAVGWV